LLDHYLAMNPGQAEFDIDGIETLEPAFGLPALWIQEQERENAEMLGYTVVDPISVLATHITEIIKANAAEILGRQDVQTLVDSVRGNYPAVVEELIPGVISLGELQKVLANLLRERVSIRDLVTIFETLADYGALTKDTEILTEYARHALSRQITKQFAPSGVLSCITIDMELESIIARSVQKTEQGSYVNLDPKTMQAFINSLNQETAKLTNMGYQPIVLANPNARLYVRRIVERSAPGLTVLSYAELESKTEIQAMGMVKI
jgi:flagellar biosynthesis protein FlhA